MTVRKAPYGIMARLSLTGYVSHLLGLLSRHCGKHNHKLSTISPRNNKLANIPQVPLCKAILTPRTYFSTTAQEGLLYCHCGARLHKYKMSSKGEPSPRIIRTSHHNNKHLIHTLWWKPSINRLVNSHSFQHVISDSLEGVLCIPPRVCIPVLGQAGSQYSIVSSWP